MSLSRLEKPLLFFLGFILLSLCMVQIVYRYKTVAPDREYLGYHEFYTDDYSIYLSNIYQGQYGRWTLLDKHTSEPHKGTIIHNEYLLWGKFTNLFKLDPIISYHLFRFSMGAVLLLVIYLFLKSLFPANCGIRILSFLFILFSFGFPKISQSASGTTIDQYMQWLTELDVFARFVALPHYLLGNIFFLLNVIVFFKISVSGINIHKSSFIILTSVLMALIHPVSVVSLSAYYAIFIFLAFFINPLFYLKNLRNLRDLMLPFIITVISAAPILLYYKYLMTIPPWNHMAAWEGVTKYNIPLKDYVGAIGPNFLLAPIGLAFAIRSWKIRYWLFLLSWILGFFLLVFFSYPFLHISEIRLMQSFIFIPFAILGANAVYSISKLVSKKHFVLVIGIFCLILFAISSPLYINSFKHKLFYYPGNSMLAFPPKEWLKSLYWLRDNTPKNSVVLCAYQAGTAIPFVSGNTVYTGHVWATLDRERKETLRDKFTTNKMTEKEAYDFFKKEKIDYFFNGYQEASMGFNPEKYRFLKPVFSSGMATVYQFIP